MNFVLKFCAFNVLYIVIILELLTDCFLLKKTTNLFKTKRVILPGVNLDVLIPLSSLLYPGHFLFSSFGILILAQLVFLLKGLLSNLEIQRLSSVQFYSRFISSNYYINSLSVYYSISQTLGFDLELLLSLSIYERLVFLLKMEETILKYKGSAKVFSEFSFILDPVSLESHRKGLALKCRSVFLLSPIFSPTSLVVNIVLSEVNILLLLESCKLMWLYIGLDLEEFSFLLFKSYLFLEIQNISLKLSFSDLLIKLIHVQLKKLISFKKNIVFSDDFIVLKSKDNLTFMERQVLCFSRPFPFSSNNLFSSSGQIKDYILKVAYNQRIYKKKKLQLSYSNYSKI